MHSVSIGHYWVTSFAAMLLSCAIAHSQTLNAEKVRWYDFYWDGSEQNPREVILLKSRIDTINFNFRWQFDTGSPRTFFYGNLWKSFLEAFPYLQNQFAVIDSLKLDGYVNVKNPSIIISDKKLPKGIVGLLPDYGELVDKQVILDNPGASVTIGTLGIDVFRQGVLLIDFKTNKIGYAAKLSDGFYKVKRNTIDFLLYQNRIVLPVEIGKKKKYFFFDSGASQFPIKTTNHFIDLLPPIRYTDTLFNITTWGKSYNVPGGSVQKSAAIGSLKINKPKVYVHPDPELYHTQIFKEAETIGLIGNEFFLGSIVVFDFTRMKMTIIN